MVGDFTKTFVSRMDGAPNLLHIMIVELAKWRMIFDGSSGPGNVFDAGTSVHLKENRVEIRVRHFSWLSAILSYFTGLQTIHMDMVPYMHPPRVTDTDTVYVNVYATRVDQPKV